MEVCCWMHSFFWIGETELFIYCHLFQFLLKMKKKQKRKKKNNLLGFLHQHDHFWFLLELCFYIRNFFRKEKKKNKTNSKNDHAVKRNQVNCFFFLSSLFFFFLSKNWNRWQQMNNSASSIQKNECIQQQTSIQQS